MKTDVSTHETVCELSRGDRLAKLRERLKKPFQGPLEVLAEQESLTLREVTDCLPASQHASLSGDSFVSILENVAEWGEILLLLHTVDGVFECRGPIEKGAIGGGYYNLGHGSPIAGHLRYERCGAVSFIRRAFHRKETASIQFFNHEGGSMFKIFLGRDPDGAIKADQLKRFEDLSGLTETPPITD